MQGTMPSVMIHPKSITGRMSLTTSEQNATMVVIVVKKQGWNMKRTVPCRLPVHSCLASFGFAAYSSP